VAEHYQNAVAAPDAAPPETVRQAVGAIAQFGETQPLLAAVLFQDPERGLPVARRQQVEIVERPVKALQARPLEAAEAAS